MNNLKKTALAAAVTTVLAASAPASAAPADWVTVDYNGWFTLITPSGNAVFNNGDAKTQAFYGNRTAVAGSMTFNTSTGAGSGTMGGFSFGGSGFAEATNISFQAVGDGTGGAGPLVLANLGFNWSGNNGIPVSLVLDASGFFGAVGGGLTTSDTISGVGSLAATDDFLFGKGTYTLPLGASPIVTTTFSTTAIGTVDLGTNPSGTLPFVDDGVGGSPMLTAPFPGFFANFDITNLHVTEVVDHHPTPQVPVPAAVWLFGSGLLGLVGVARRRKRA